MRARTIQAALVSLMLAASAPIAHAGGGGAGSPVPGLLFDCYVIFGADAPQTLNLDDQFGARTGARLGRARLLCTPANGIVDTGQLQPGDFSLGDHLTCYESLSFQGANVTKQIVDPFTAQTVKVLGQAFTCAQAFKCDVGESCLPPPGAE
jgi:hypothetical protein